MFSPLLEQIIIIGLNMKKIKKILNIKLNFQLLFGMHQNLYMVQHMDRRTLCIYTNWGNACQDFSEENTMGNYNTENDGIILCISLCSFSLYSWKLDIKHCMICSDIINTINFALRLKFF